MHDRLSQLRWNRVAGLAWWAVLLIALVMVPSLGQWPGSVVLWASVLPITVLLIGDEQ